MRIAILALLPALGLFAAACSDQPSESTPVADADAEAMAPWRGAGNVIEFTPTPYNCGGCEGAVMAALEGVEGIARSEGGSLQIDSNTSADSAEAYVRVTIADGVDRDAMIAKLREAVHSTHKAIYHEEAESAKP